VAAEAGELARHVAFQFEESTATAGAFFCQTGTTKYPFAVRLSQFRFTYRAPPLYRRNMRL
jgi:hypothetical protein